MATPIDKVVGTWTSYQPLTAVNVSIDPPVGSQKRVSWGTPTGANRPYIGFTPASPPTQMVETGSEFKLGSITFANNSVEEDEQEVEKLTLQLQVKIDFFTAVFSLTFTLEPSGAASDVLGFADPLPITIAGTSFTINITGFRKGINLLPSISVVMDSTETWDIAAKLTSSPIPSSGCGGGEPVFKPPCTIEDVCAIPEDPIIADCYIPDAPSALTDCPDVDIPMGTSTPIDGISGGIMGPPGPPGPPGPAGQEGCIPYIQMTYNNFYSSEPGCQPGVIMAQLPMGACGIAVDFTFIICKPKPATGKPGGGGCCMFVCCNGYWTGSEGCDPEILDSGTGCSGQGSVMWYCDCPTSSTTSSTTSTTTPTPTTTSTTPGPTSTSSTTIAPAMFSFDSGDVVDDQDWLGDVDSRDW